MRTFEYKGLMFRVIAVHDDSIGPPWKEYDGHGIVSYWRPADSKAPGERVLHSDRGRCRFYDMRATMDKARNEKWGLGTAELAALAVKLGRDPKPGDIVAAAVDADFERLRAWCNDEWCYEVLHVELQDTAGNSIPSADEYLGGVESDATEHAQECAQEMAAEIIARLELGPRRKTVKLGQNVYRVRS